MFCTTDATTCAAKSMARYILWLQAPLSVAIAAHLCTSAAGQYRTEVSQVMPTFPVAIAWIL